MTKHVRSRAESPTATAVVSALGARDLLHLVDDVCSVRGVTRADLCGRVRSRSVARARQEVWWRLSRHPERFYSLLEIARLFDRDHATVRAGIIAHGRRLAERADRDADFGSPIGGTS